MAVPWTPRQRALVAKILDEFPVDSSRCEQAAAQIIPLARQLDPEAVARICEPLHGRFVCPRRRWFYHVTIYVAEHFVDALTGPDGLKEEHYIQTHWPHRSALQWKALPDTELKDLAR